jgi:hypothetical protein
MVKPTVFVLCFLSTSAMCLAMASGLDDDENDGKDSLNATVIFNERIMPIFRSPDPSSCVQCHLSSVDLKNYILPSHEQTFVSLRDQGLIDLKQPEKSKILKLIEMGDKDADKGAQMIHAKMRKAERDAFASWIKASCSDAELVKLPPLEKSLLAKPDRPNEVIRHARKSRVVDSFARHVWSQRMRCFPCHTPHEIGPNQKGPREKFAQWERKFGERMRIFKKTPEATLDYLVDMSQEAKQDRLPMLDLKQPTKSLLVLKPLSKLPPKQDDNRVPTYTEPIYHMGGLKMHMDDHSYKAFIAWIEDYAKVTSGQYTSVDELPADNWRPTQRVLRMRDVPEAWEIGKPVQLFVHQRNDAGDDWIQQPVAFTQGTITPRRIVNGPLILLTKTDQPKPGQAVKHETPLPPGDYLVKVFLDDDKKLAADPTVLLDESDYQGQIIVPNARWQIGFPKAQWAEGKQLSK